MSRDTPVFVTSENGEWVAAYAGAPCAAATLRCAARAPEEEAAWACSRPAGATGTARSGGVACAGSGSARAGLPRWPTDLYQSIIAQGRVDSVIEWLDLLPADELARRPRLLLAAAWSLALGQRNDEAERIVERILAQPDVDDALRCECALIVSGAAVFADDPDRFVELHDPWAEAPPLRDPLLLKITPTAGAFRALLEGDLSLARLRQQQAPRGDFGKAPGFVSRWGELITALTYLWEGQVLLAENLLRPSLAGAEADLGRRHPFACMLAACWLRLSGSEPA